MCAVVSMLKNSAQNMNMKIEFEQRTTNKYTEASSLNVYMVGIQVYSWNAQREII